MSLLRVLSRRRSMGMRRWSPTWKRVENGRQRILGKVIARRRWLPLLICAGRALRRMLTWDLWEDVLGVEHHLLISPLGR